MPTEDSDPARIISDLVRGAWRTLAARAMAELRLADALAEPASAEELAARTSTHAPTLARLLRALAAMGLVSYERGTYELTEAGARLRSDVPGSDWGAMMMMPADWTLATWQQLPEAVRSGEPVFEQVHGQDFWEFLRTHEHAGRIFDAAMARRAKDEGVADRVVEELERAGAETVVDVGGGTGRLLAQVVARLPRARGVLADQREPVEQSAEVFAAHGVEGRCDAVECDFFDGVPRGANAYLLSNILHDWDDEGCARILHRIHEAAAPGAQVLVLETLLPDEEDGVAPESAAIHLLDLMMLLNFGARERTLEQYSDLLVRGGFTDVRRIDAGYQDLVVASTG